MIMAIRLEYLKMRTTRMWLGLLALGGGLTALVAVTLSARAGTGGIVPTLASAAGQRDILTTTGFGLMAAMVSGTTIVTGEYRHKIIATTYLDQPDRGRVLAAKVIVASLAGLLARAAQVRDLPAVRRPWHCRERTSRSPCSTWVPAGTSRP